MKKVLIIFIMCVVLLVVARMAYDKYCESKEGGCTERKMDYEKDGLPREGMEW
ncbi:MAG: hypothetical protein L3J43_08480 [Sulfurovum sp.]|nr:hypothetical protein [Sulfurovum sp.]